MPHQRHILRTQDFSEGWIERLFKKADILKGLFLQNNDYRMRLQLGNSNKSVRLAFYEASTRTAESFHEAGELAGLRVRNLGNMKAFSSAVKGETLEDTIRVLCGQRPDIIVLRHDEEGASARAAAVADDFAKETGRQTWIVNAGDGPGQHPTQALLDLYTLREKFGTIENLKIVFGGDLRYGRTVRSLAYLLAKFGNPEFLFVSMPELSPSRNILEHLEERKVQYSLVGSLEEALERGGKFDAWYWTRSQSERIQDPEMKKRIEGREREYDLTPFHLDRMGSDTIVLHPLPRKGEIVPQCDSDLRAWYFRQSDNGIPIRMALYEYLCDIWE